MIKKLSTCVGEYKGKAILAPLMVICEVIIEVYIPKLMADIVNVGIPSGNIGYVTKLGLLMVGMAVVSMVFGAVSGWFASVASAGFAKNIRARLFNSVQDFSFANVDKFSTASLITRMTTDINYVRMSFMMIIRMLVRAPFMLIAATSMAVSINARLSLIFAVVLPLLITIIACVIPAAYRRFEKMFKRYDSMNASVQENLIAIRVVKAFVRHDYENEKFEESADLLRKAQLAAERMMVYVMPVMQFVMYACILSVLWFGGKLILGGEMLTGDLIQFISYINQILMSLMMISFSFVTIVMSKASAQRIVEVFDERPQIRDDAAEAALAVADGSIEFHDVSFSYAGDRDNLTLQNINLRIASGEKIGVIGGTGSAKSTLVQLIPRLYDVTQGRLLVGGRDVRDYKLAQLRGAVSMVLQKNLLFSGTIRENLRWGNPNATEEQLVAACKAAQADAFIRTLPNGYDTDLGQGGVNVSGGQKQRLCIARALLRSPKILILDDSTSAVDTATDARIRESFRTGLADVTTIVIAQRVTSVCDLDRIVVMDDGKINAVGTHAELLASNKIYQEVWQSQQKGVA